jgi:hypothetical protein
MKRQFGPMLVALLLLCAPAAWSQSGSDSGQSGSSDSSQSGSTDSSQSGSTDLSQGTSNDPSQQTPAGPQSTFLHPEQLPPLNLLNESTALTGIRLNFQTGAVADYQSGNSSYGNYWQNIGVFAGGISISQLRPNLLWTVAYNGGVSITSLSSGVPGYNSLNQAGNGVIHWSFAKRWILRVKDNYMYTNDPFEPFLTSQIQPTYNNPNPLIYVPQAVTESNFGTADISYQLGPRDTIDISGSESFQRFLRGTFGLQNSYTWGGAAFYEHAFSERLEAGVGYNFTALDFGHGQSRAGIQMFEGFVTYNINRRLQVSGWLGPEETNTKDLVPVLCIPGYGCLYEIEHESAFNIAEGGTLTYSGSRDAVRFRASHRVTNGGGLLGAATLYQADFAYIRTLTPRWGFRLGVDYDNNVSVSHFRLNQYLKAIQGTVGFTRKISDSWNANFYYALIHQSQDYFVGPSTLKTNGLGITVRYTWGHSLGR